MNPETPQTSETPETPPNLPTLATSRPKRIYARFKGPGQPLKIQGETLEKILKAWSFGATDEEALAAANVSHTALENFLRIKPEYKEIRDKLKVLPVYEARQVVVEAARTRINPAQWYLERKARAEFGQKPEVLAIGLDLTSLIERAEAKEMEKPSDNAEK